MFVLKLSGIQKLLLFTKLDYCIKYFLAQEIFNTFKIF